MFRLLFIFVALIVAPFVEAQQYTIEVVTPIGSDPELGIDIASDGFVLSEVTTNGQKCPVARNIRHKSHYRLCDVGMTKAYAINRRGEVVGYREEAGKRVAVRWSAKQGLQVLGSLPGFDQSIATDVNDKGVIVGFAYRTENYSIYFDGDDYGGDSDRVQDADEETYSVSLQTLRGFKVSGGHDMVEAFPTYQSRSNFATHINNKGSIIGAVSDEIITPLPTTIVPSDDVQGQYSYSAVLSVPGRRTRFVGNSHVFPSRPSIDDSDISQLGVGPKDEYVVGNYLYRHKKKVIGAVLITGRNDYFGEGPFINRRGQVALSVSNRAHLYTDKRGNVALNCLIPQDSRLKGEKITGSGLTLFYVAGINDAGEILATGDALGDGRSERLFIVRPNAEDRQGTLQNFCVSFSIQYIGTCGSAIEGATGDCTVQVEAYAGREKYQNVRFQVVAEDYEDHKLQCAQSVVTQKTTGRGKAELTFPFNPAFTYSIQLAGDDARRFLAEPEVIRGAGASTLDDRCTPYE